MVEKVQRDASQSLSLRLLVEVQQGSWVAEAAAAVASPLFTDAGHSCCRDHGSAVRKAKFCVIAFSSPFTPVSPLENQRKVTLSSASSAPYHAESRNIDCVPFQKIKSKKSTI